MSIVSLTWDVAHDPCRSSDRKPLGAVTLGTPVQVALRIHDDALKLVESVDVVIEEQGDRHNIRLELQDGAFSGAIILKNEPHAAFYHFEIACADDTNCYYVPRADGRSTVGELVEEIDDAVRGFQITVYDGRFATPDWLAGAVMYQVFPDRFARGESGVREEGVRYHREMKRPVHMRDNWNEQIAWKNGQAYDPVDFYGGTIEGIREKLPYIASLGVEVIYLNPVFEARSNHRYDTADYERIDALLGTEADFAALCSDAAEFGIHIVCDAVLSHTGDDSRYFNARQVYEQPGAAQGPESPYYAWYDFSSAADSLKYRCWWGDPSLPEVDERNGEWQGYIFGTVLPKWLSAGAGGYRLDVADELPDDALENLRTSVKAHDQQAVIIGEVWEDATTKESYGAARTYALGRSLDSVMNYPLRNALVDFATGASDAYQLATFLKLQQSNYPEPMYRCLMNLLSSHDVERIRTVLALGEPIRNLSRQDQYDAVCSITDDQDEHGAHLQGLIAGILYALPGTPCIYYGDERGMHGGGDPFCRAPMVWGNPDNRNDYGKDLTSLYRDLGSIRRNSPALRKGSMACQALDDNTLCIVRINDSVNPAMPMYAIAVASRADADKTFAIDLRELEIDIPDDVRFPQSSRFLAIEDGIVSVKAPALGTTIICFV